MSRCNVDFFDRKFNNVHHDTVPPTGIDDDYLAPETNTIYIGYTEKVVESGFIHISGDLDFFGVVTKVSDDSKVTQVDYKPFISLFNHPVLFDTNLQSGNKSLETVLGDLIKQYWISSGDTYQDIPRLTVKTISETKNWGFNIKSDKEDMHHAIVGLHDVLLNNALTKYGVSVRVKPNLSTKSILLEIGKSSNTIVVEADLPSVDIQTFTINDMEGATNKLDIWNSTNYTEKISYYVHPTGSYDTSNRDRIEPVVLDVSAVDPETSDIYGDLYAGSISSTGEYQDQTPEPSTAQEVFTELTEVYEGGTLIVDDSYATPQKAWFAVALYDKDRKFLSRPNLVNTGENKIARVQISYKLPDNVKYVIAMYQSRGEFRPTITIREPFKSAAAREASSKLSSITRNNLIELIIKNSARLPMFSDMVFGQTVYISHEGSLYPSILTGKKLEAGLVQLIFGTVRTELTKKLALGG